MRSGAAAALLLALSLFLHPLVAADPVETDDPALALTPTERDEERYGQFHRRFVERAQSGSIDLLFVGDSITWGWTEAGRAVFDEYFAKDRAAVFAIPGDQTQWMHWRLRDGELQGYEPKWVVLMAGTNNLKSGPTRMSPRATAAGVNGLVNLFRSTWPRARIIVCAILPRQTDKYPWMPAAVRQTNALIAQEAAFDKRVRFIDIGAAYLDEGGAVRADLMPDLLHPNEAGYRIWAEALDPVLHPLQD